MRRTCSFARPLTLLFALLSGLGLVTCAGGVQAADLPFAAGSPLIGFTFDDKPLLLPPQQNFQMAMLTAGTELGRTCGKMEAYGWRMNQSEQARVNTIFNATVDRLRGLGYTVTPQNPNSVSHDITLFAADRVDRHFLFMWSAGEIGLVMTLCETNAPLHGATAATSAPSVQTFPDAVVQSRLEAPAPATRQAAANKFTPVGVWMGGYSCAQGYTGGTLQIEHLKGENFDGVFSFYPTPKNPGVPRGSYNVYGQYDAESKRILINPGQWIQRPPHYYNTVIVGGFDSVNNSFSAYFQGINGCTSFEAKYAGTAAAVPHAAIKAVAQKKVVKKKKKAKVVTKLKADKDAAAAVVPVASPAPAPVPAAPVAPVETAAPVVPPVVPSAAPAATQAQTPPAVTAPASAPTPTPAVAAPVTAPVTPAPAPASAVPAPAASTAPTAPAAIMLPATAPTSTPAAATATPAASSAPATTPVPVSAPVAAPAVTPPSAPVTPPPPSAAPAAPPAAVPASPATTGQKSGAVETDRSKWIKVALASGYENSGQWIRPQAPQAAAPTKVMPPQSMNTVPVGVNPALPAPAPNYVSPADVAQPPTMISGLPQRANDPMQAMPAPTSDRQPIMADVPVYARDTAPSVPDPQRVPDYGYGGQ